MFVVDHSILKSGDNRQERSGADEVTTLVVLVIEQSPVLEIDYRGYYGKRTKDILGGPLAAVGGPKSILRTGE